MSHADTISQALFLRSHRRAVCVTRERQGKKQYRIAPYEPRRVGDVPLGGFLSGWCSSEARAWDAALKRQSHRANDREHW